MKTSAVLMMVGLTMASGCGLLGTKPLVVGPGIPPAAKADAQQLDQTKQTAATAAKTAEVQGAALSTASGAMGTAAQTIKTENQEVRGIIPEPQKTAARPHLDAIDTQATAIKAEADKMDRIASELSVMAGKLNGMNDAITNLTTRNTIAQEELLKAGKTIAALQESNRKLQDDRDAAMQRNLMYLVILGTICIAISLILFFYGQPKAIGGAIGGAVLIGVSLAIMAMTKIAWLFGLIGGLGFAVLFGTMVWYVVDYLRHRKGLAEVVESAEAAKANMTDAQKEVVFGSKAVKGVLQYLQSDSTKVLVKEAKAKLKKVV